MSIQLENYGNNTFVLISFLFTLMKENHKKVNFSVYSEIIFMIINFRVRREEDKLIKIIKNHMWWRNHPFIKIKPSNIRKESMPTLSLSRILHTLKILFFIDFTCIQKIVIVDITYEKIFSSLHQQQLVSHLHKM